MGIPEIKARPKDDPEYNEKPGGEAKYAKYEEGV